MPVIVDCESCHTRFRLDEARIPPTGAKVRCSKCKASFIVQRPSATREEIIEEVVAEATNPGTSRAPAPTEDLFGASGSSIGEPNGASDAEPSSDEKWEFDEPPRAAAPRAAKQPKETGSPGAPRGADDLDSLGSPEGWDFLGGAREAAAEARFETPAAERPAPPPPRAVAAEAPQPAHAPSVDSSLAAALGKASRTEQPPAAGWVEAARGAGQSLIDSGVWLASIALCSVGLALSLAPMSATPPSRASTAIEASLGASKVEVARSVLESGVGGTLTIVRGQLPPSAAGEPSRLRATWLDANGEPIAGASAVAGPPLPARELRERSLERLRAAHEARAHELSGGGAFEAAFGVLPADARGIALRRERVPVFVPEATQIVVEVTDAPGAEPVTASSRPTARPSSSE